MFEGKLDKNLDMFKLLEIKTTLLVWYQFEASEMLVS